MILPPLGANDTTASACLPLNSTWVTLTSIESGVMPLEATLLMMPCSTASRVCILLLHANGINATATANQTPDFTT